MRQRERKPCPKCGGLDAVVRVVYGYPTPELERAAKRGEVDHGGCWSVVLTPSSPAAVAASVSSSRALS